MSYDMEFVTRKVLIQVSWNFPSFENSLKMSLLNFRYECLNF